MTITGLSPLLEFQLGPNQWATSFSDPKSFQKGELYFSRKDFE